MGLQIDLLQFPKIKRELGRRTDAHRAIARQFGKDFFDGDRDVGYGGYKDDGRWAAVAQRLITHYKLCANATVLDIGCAKGYLVNELVKLGIDAYGLDISGYALAHCPNGIANRLMHRNANNLPPRAFDLTISINTLHNLEYADCAYALNRMSVMSKHQYVTVDAYNDEQEEERMFAWNLTARTILSVPDWIQMFTNCGYTGDYDWFIP